ncbi:MAG: Gfo/Idh/MocA family protein [Planctomycetota bacterium]|jgi:predicted dehydrogenase
MKVAVCGFQHSHIAAIVKEIQAHPELEIAAAVEEDPDSCADIIAKAGLEITHSSLDEVLENIEFDILAIGDIYCKRGKLAIKALGSGKHIVSDKPICTELSEITEIQRLVKEKKLSFFAQLNMRYTPAWQAARSAILAGEIGEVATVEVTGHHRIDYKNGRPDWYFVEGKHAGTFTDLFIHGMDGVEWMTGRSFSEVFAARAWNQQVKEFSFFQDGAQALLKLDNSGGVMMDASYVTPKSHKDRWMFHFYGTEGDIALNTAGPVLMRKSGGEKSELKLGPKGGRNLTDDLIAEITASGEEQILTTAESLRAAEISLQVQEAADKGKFEYSI